MPEHPSLTSLLTPCYIHSYSIAEGIWLGRTQSLYLRRNPQWGRCCATINISQKQKLQRTLFWEEVLEHFRYCKNYHELDPTPTDVDGTSWFSFEMVSFAPRHRRSAIHQLWHQQWPALHLAAWPGHTWSCFVEVSRPEVQMVLWSSSREVSDPVDEFWGFLEKFRSCDAA